MAMKPERAYPNLSSTRRIVAERNADFIENHIFNLAREFYGDQFRIERFTEIHWNIYRKKPFFSFLRNEGEDRLFVVEIMDPLPEGYYREVTETFIYIEFLKSSLGENIDVYEETVNDGGIVNKILKDCQRLHNQTGLIVGLRVEGYPIKYVPAPSEIKK